MRGWNRMGHRRFDWRARRRPHPPEGSAGLVCVIEAIVRDETPKRASDARLHTVGETLRTSWQTPTDTMITDDIPTLLTKLSQVPKSRKRP